MAPQPAAAAALGEPHDIRKGIIRRQGGRLPRCSIQRVGMGCAFPCRIRPLANGVCFVLGTCTNIGFAITAFSDKACPVARQVRMTRHLGFRERGLAHSAGNTQSAPSTPRLPGLRRGSHNAPHSTAAGCWQPRNWHRTGCACATETPLSG